MIENEMFEEIMKLFPDFNYQNEFYDEYRSYPTVDGLLHLAYSQLCESAGMMIMDYGAGYRSAINPEIGDEFRNLEKQEDEIFGEFIKFFDFYYKYRSYSERFKNSNFEEYSGQSL
ncbi:hypothetical protein [Lactococcus lactis]|uniref:hypothetical protein n=1 Tax=Lactococcus lactis TaxID=1358 RepID=UPI0022E8FA84|nr:hypothetical protein [Lactococcus lactis]